MNADEPPTTTLEDAWPLFGLRIRSDQLELRLPTDEDIITLIDVARADIHPPGEMPFGIAWSVVPSPGFEQSFLRHHWHARSAWTSADWVLHLGVWYNDEPIGAQSVMASRSWSGRPAVVVDQLTARPAGSFAVALARAREAWDGLTGGPTVPPGPDIEPGNVMVLGPDDEPPVRLLYSEAAAAAILATALGLWADTAAGMERPGDDEG